MEYLNIENADKFALYTLMNIVDEKKFQKSLIENLMIHHYVSTTIKLLSYYIKHKIINPVKLFYETDCNYEALMIWKASEGTDFSCEKFFELWDEENPISQEKKKILYTDQNDIIIDNSMDFLIRSMGNINTYK